MPQNIFIHSIQIEMVYVYFKLYCELVYIISLYICYFIEESQKKFREHEIIIM